MRILTDQQKIDIVNEYNENISCGIRGLSKKYKVSETSISSLLKNRGVKIRFRAKKYSVNEDYFKIIDTEDKAYFLGLMYADGCVHNDKGNRLRVSISLQDGDKDIIELFKEKCEFSGCIYKIDRKIKNKNWNNMVRIRIFDKIFAQNLINLGCTPQKSLTLKFPTEEQVPRNLIRHFIRGYFDGDGCIHSSYRGGKYFRVTPSIVSTKDFCQIFSMVIKEELGIETYIGKTYSKRSDITKVANILKMSEAIKFLDWIYKDATVFLQRKYDKYIWTKDKCKQYMKTKRGNKRYFNNEKPNETISSHF